MTLQGKLIVEVSELDSFARADVPAVKRVLSCQVDRFRAPCERTSRDWPRQCVFVGTTNRDDWGRDETGARRFWPIRCSAVNLDYIRTTRAQLPEAFSHVFDADALHHQVNGVGVAQAMKGNAGRDVRG